jgi:hypothetical protein
MLKSAFVAVLGLAVVGHSFVLAEDRLDSQQTVGPTTQSHVILSSSAIARIKAALRLTREQEQYWPPVEAALRAITGHAAQGAVAPQPLVLDQAKMQRLAAVAGPLLMRLDDEQKRAAAAFARSVGLGPMLAAF